MPRHFKNWLKAYAQYTRASESPQAFHFWTAVSTIAAVLQRKVWIDERVFQWTPNFYIIFVGPPGVVAKSTTVRIGANLLREIPGVIFGPNSLTWAALTESLASAQRGIPLDNKGIEGELLHMSSITCSINELGTFLDPNDRKLVDVFTDLWDGQIGVWEHATKTSGTTKINNPWLNVIGATTPSWLKNNFPESMVGGGLTSRIIFVYGDQKRSFIPYPSQVQTKEEQAILERKLIDDLNDMNEMIGEYILTPEALAWGAAWYEDHWTNKNEELASDRYEGYIARKQTHLHKLAIVLAASQRSELIITENDLIMSNKCIQLIEKDMIKVFQSIGSTEENKTVTTMINYLLTFNKVMPQTTLWEKMSVNVTVKDFSEATDAALKAGYIQLRNSGTAVNVHLIKVPEQMQSNSPTAVSPLE